MAAEADGEPGLGPALITGAGKGLGAALGRALAHRGIPVVLVARTSQDVRAVAEDIGEHALAVAGDVSKRGDVALVFHRATERFGETEILVNNAAIFGPVAPLWESDPDEWRAVQEVNVYGAYLCLRQVLPGMMKRRRGQVLAISSGAAHNTLRFHSAYNTSKAALDHLHRLADAEVRGSGVKVAILEPGGIDTPMMNNLIARDFPDVGLFRDFQARGLLRTAQEVASGVAALLISGVEPGRRYDIEELIPQVSHGL